MPDRSSSFSHSLDDHLDRRIALCLGAHRSGTSLLAAAIETVGAELALPDRNVSEENLKGFFEHAEVVALNDDLLDLAGSAWDDGLFESRDIAKLPPAKLEALHVRARRIVDEQLRPADLSAIKDPRLCRLLPFWFSVLDGAGYLADDIRCVIVTRDPVEIAISQRTRCRRNPDFYDFGQSLAEGMVLWLGHVRQALRDCAGRKVLVIAYRDFLERPAELMGRLSDFLSTRPDPKAVDRFVSEFVTDSLWRSHADEAAIAEIEAVFPGLLAAERELAALSGRTLDGGELAPILAVLGDFAFDVAARDIVAHAYGRLSARRRLDRQEALRTEHALKVAQQARDTFARSRAEVAEAARDLQQRITGEYEVRLAEASKIEGNLRSRIGELETGIADRDARLDALRSEQDNAIRQLAAAFERNGQDLAQARSALDEAQQQAVLLNEELERRDAEGAALEGQRQELAGRLAELSAQFDHMHRDWHYLQQVTEEMRASHSWRFTKPLRAAGSGMRGLKGLSRKGMHGLNRASQVTHQRLKRSHPRTAEVLRRAIQPLMARANMKLLGQYNVHALPGALTSPNLPDGAFAFDYQQPQVHSPYRPLVTIIVPNYNHAAYLARRLESIYAQTYDHYEVLLLDDCSSDDSRQVLQNFAARHPDRTRLLFNETNSGGVFRQWEKGLAAARGELVWIAESDDWASPNFLETLVPFFQNEAVQLAYARTIFMDGAGESQIWSMEEYLNQYGPERWGQAWVETAPNIVRDVFSMVNIIPNVSSAMFRRFERLDVLEIDEWREMRTCGDWMFYLNALRGGMMAYSPDAQNFYRIHDRNTSVSSHKADQFYCEHEAVAKCIRRHYRVPPANLARMEENLRHHWKITRNDYSDKAFTACFDRSRIEVAPTRRPGLLMVGYAFCAGGGEAFPIQLANEMKALGYEVTFLDCAQEERIAGVRARLASDIPVISNFPDLRRIVQNFDIDLIHSHHGWVDNTVLDLMPEDSACRTVITLHGFYETLPSRQLSLVMPRLLRRTAAMVYIAEKNLEPLRADGAPINARFYRIDNAVSRTSGAPVERAALGIADDAFVLVLVSRALHAKGWAEAVAATSLARQISGKDIQLVLVGDGEAKDAIEAAGVPEHVHLEGFRPNTQSYLAAADLGFLPSRFKGESFPLVVIESLIAGTPVLASDVGEIAYMLDTPEGMAGVLFSLDPDWQIDVDALAQIVAALASNPAEMDRLRTRVPKAAARFDPRKMAEDYSNVYLEAAGMKTATSITNPQPRVRISTNA